MRLKDIRTTQKLLTIQEFVYLLDEFHYSEFCHALQKAEAALPLKLLKAIHEKLPQFDSHNDLCVKVYGSVKQKQNFNQLASYTLKLSNLLAQNYPSYLRHNVSLIEKEVNCGNVQHATFRAERLLKIADLVEDFQTQIATLQFLSQQAFLTRNTTSGFKLNHQLIVTVDTQNTFNQIITHLRKTLHLPSTALKAQNMDEVKQFYSQHFLHPAASVRIISMYAYLYAVYYHHPVMFSHDEDIRLIKKLQRELSNNSQVIFPFLFDIKGVFNFLLLNSPLANSNTIERNKHVKELAKHHNSVLFWKNYLDMPLVFSIAAQASSFVTKLHFKVHRKDYPAVAGQDNLLVIQDLIKKCNTLLDTVTWENHYKNDLVSIKLLHGALLILAGGNNIHKGTEELELLLTSYQQLNFSGSTDSIFLSLMIGYFSASKHEQCNDTYKRYLKVIKSKPVYQANDISIHTYYYLSRWLTTGSKQYVLKLAANYDRAKLFANSQQAMIELTDYFKVPVTFVGQ